MSIEHILEANKHRIPVQIYLDPKDFAEFIKRARQKNLTNSTFGRWVIKLFLANPTEEDQIQEDIKNLKKLVKNLYELNKSRSNN